MTNCTCRAEKEQGHGTHKNSGVCPHFQIRSRATACLHKTATSTTIIQWYKPDEKKYALNKSEKINTHIILMVILST